MSINPDLCVRDGLCARVCGKVFAPGAKGEPPVVAHEDSCNSCGHCVLMCPTGAISVTGCFPETIHQAEAAQMPGYEQTRELIVTRRSIRNFLPKPVGKETLEKVIECARYAPSAKNSQSTRFTVIEDNTRLRSISEATARWLGGVSRKLSNPLWRTLYRLAGERDVDEIKRWVGQFARMEEKTRSGSDAILFNAPALILFHADRRTRFASENASLAAGNAMLGAHSLGLGAFYAGYVVTACSRDKAVRDLIPLAKEPKGLRRPRPRLALPLLPRWIERNPSGINWL